MGFFSKKKSIDVIVNEYTTEYNLIINEKGNSKEAFKNLAKHAFKEATRLKRTIHTEEKSAYSWFSFDITKMTGVSNADRDLIASYIFNAIASAHKDFWEPVSHEKMELLHILIDKSLI